MAATVERFGTLTILVNNAVAAARTSGTVTELADEDWKLVLEVNLLAVVRLCRHAIPAMAAAGHGSIVNISSRAGERGTPRQVAYSTTKGGLNALTRSIAVDHAAQGIRCNSVSPGYVRNERRDAGMSDERRQELEAMPPAGAAGGSSRHRLRRPLPGQPRGRVRHRREPARRRGQLHGPGPHPSARRTLGGTRQELPISRRIRQVVRRMAVLGALALAFGLLGLPAAVGGRPVSAASPFPDCAQASPDPTLVVGSVSCLLVPSQFVGGDDPVSYFIPPACDPVLGRRCPVLYLLHGFGGDYHGMLGRAATPSGWVQALTAGPPVDPRSVADPWDYGPATWVPKPALDLILVAPHGRTLPGGYGPAPGLDSFWTDWNPRYGKGGDSPKYATPPPRYSAFLTDELLPYVEAHFPTLPGREWRAIAGTSLGGYGSYKNALQHPDLWTSMGSVSGAHNFLFAPAPDPLPASSPVGLQPPVPTGYVRVPGTAANVPLAALPSQAQGFAAALLALGDPAADQAFYRGNMPRDLAVNAHAQGDAGVQSLYVKGFSNDTVPRRAADASDPGGIAFEDIVLPMNVAMESAFAAEGVANDYDLHPGIHSDPYRYPWLREQLEAQYARLAHPGGDLPGSPPSAATRFDFRSISTDFSVWGWRVHVDRTPVEFLNLRDVTCRSLTLQGTGVVTATVPDACPTPTTRGRTFTVDLGPSMPADEPAGAGATPVYGRTVSVDLAGG